MGPSLHAIQCATCGVSTLHDCDDVGDDRITAELVVECVRCKRQRMHGALTLRAVSVKEPDGQ